MRKPLSRLVIPVLSDKVREQFELVKNIILTEVNVKEAEFIHDTTGIITKKIKPNFKTLGKAYGKQMKEIAAAFGSLNQEQIALIEQAPDGYTLSLPSGDVLLKAGDYEISSEDMPGWLVASEGPLTVALDVTLTPALIREGTARELINRIQNLRKDSGLDIVDRISVSIWAEGDAAEEIRSSLEDFSSYIAGQTLARTVTFDPSAADAAQVEWNGGNINISVKKLD